MKCVKGIIIIYDNLTPKCSFICALEHGCEVVISAGKGSIAKTALPDNEAKQDASL